MNTEIDYDLTPDQWEVLKALREPSDRCRGLSPFAVEILVTLQLATVFHSQPVITRKGRSVLLRGSPRLWDVAA
jgi:hypothetical protein